MKKISFTQREINLIEMYREIPDDTKDFIDMTIKAAFDKAKSEKLNKRNNA